MLIFWTSSASSSTFDRIRFVDTKLQFYDHTFRQLDQAHKLIALTCGLASAGACRTWITHVASTDCNIVNRGQDADNLGSLAANVYLVTDLYCNMPATYSISYKIDVPINSLKKLFAISVC